MIERDPSDDRFYQRSESISPQSQPPRPISPSRLSRRARPILKSLPVSSHPISSLSSRRNTLSRHKRRSFLKRPRSASCTRHLSRKPSSRFLRATCRSERIAHWIIGRLGLPFRKCLFRKAQCRRAEYLGWRHCVSNWALKSPASPCQQGACQPPPPVVLNRLVQLSRGLRMRTSHVDQRSAAMLLVSL